MPGVRLPQTWAYNPTLYAPKKYQRACRYDAFIPALLQGIPLSLEVSIAGLVSEAEAAIRALNESAKPALKPLARGLLRTESIASSKIEGLQIGIRELLRAEARVEAGRKTGPTALEVLANIDAMELAVHDAAGVDHFTVKEIIAIHSRLMERAPNASRAGQIRSAQNWIGGNDYNPCGADFVPPPPEYLDGLLTDLCAAINDDVLPPLVQAALVHAQFETIHPFDDGNGRTGRALIHVVLHRRGIAHRFVPPISVLLASARNRYIAGLVGFQNDRISEWIEYFAGAAAGAAHLALRYVRLVDELIAQWRTQLRESTVAPRANATAWVIIDILPAHPVITAPVAAAATGRSKPQIYQGLKELQTAGVIAPLSQSRRNQSWEAVGLLDLMAALEAGQLAP